MQGKSCEVVSCDLCIAPHIPCRFPGKHARNRIGDIAQMLCESFYRAFVKADLGVSKIAIVDQKEVSDCLTSELWQLGKRSHDIDFSSLTCNELSADEVVESDCDAVWAHLS